MTVWGADPEELDRLAQLFDQAGAVLDQHRGQLAAQVHHSPWQGPNADQFRHDWDRTYSPTLASAVEFLRQSNAELRRNAAQQAAVSSTAGPAGPAGSSHGLGGLLSSARADAGSLLRKVTPGERQMLWNALVNPEAALILATPAMLRAAHLKSIRIGDDDDHVIVTSKGLISVKVAQIKTEATVNEETGSFKAQVVGLGVEHTDSGAWGVLAAPGIKFKQLSLSAGIEDTYNPTTHTFGFDGHYDVGAGKLDSGGTYHHDVNLQSGDTNTSVSIDNRVGGLEDVRTASEHNGQFVSTSVTDSATAGPLTVSHMQSQAVTADGSFVTTTSNTQTVVTHVGLDSTYFAIDKGDFQVSHTDSVVTTHSPTTGVSVVTSDNVERGYVDD